MPLDKAFALYEAGDRAGARALAEQILLTASGNAEALHLLAVIAQDENRQAGAEDFARRALSVAPGQSLYLNTLGNGLAAQGRSAEAIAMLEDAVKAAPSQADIMFNLAKAVENTSIFEKGRTTSLHLLVAPIRRAH